VRCAAVLLTGLIACGRIGFDDVSDGGIGDGARSGGDGVAPGQVTWVKTFVQHAGTATSSLDIFTGQAAHVGDAVVLEVFCTTGSSPLGVSVTGSGWSFARIGTVVGSMSTGYWGTSLGAIAPNTALTTFTVAWNASNPCGFVDELGDEFADNNPAGGSATFDAHAEMLGTGSCNLSLTTQHADDAVWSACTVNDVQAAGPGYTESANDGHEDGSEYKLTTDPAGTLEQVSFQVSASTPAYVATAVTIAP
jgi:hypothetical protein